MRFHHDSFFVHHFRIGWIWWLLVYFCCILGKHTFVRSTVRSVCRHVTTSNYNIIKWLLCICYSRQMMLHAMNYISNFNVTMFKIIYRNKFLINFCINIFRFVHQYLNIFFFYCLRFRRTLMLFMHMSFFLLRNMK